MLILTIAASYLPAFLFMVDSEFKFFTKSAFYSALGVTNILFSTTTKGYFDTQKLSSSRSFIHGLWKLRSNFTSSYR
jgi:hypothetical protein